MKIISKISILIVLFAASTVLVSSCQNEKVKEKEKSELQEIREEMLSKYETLKSDIDKRIDEIDNRLEDASAEAKEGLEDSKEELLNERSELEKAIDDIEDASDDTWDEVSAFAEKTYDSVKKGVQKIAQDIEEWFE